MHWERRWLRRLVFCFLIVDTSHVKRWSEGAQVLILKKNNSSREYVGYGQ